MKKNIIITGGNLFNKGAQSMTFTVVDEMKKRYSNKDIYLLSNRDFKRSESKKNKYNFNILPEGGPRLKLRNFYPITKIFIKNKNFPNEIEKKLVKVFAQTSFAIDISGYHLSSQFNKKRNLRYFWRLKMFKKYDVPVYIFPQSIGPFNYEVPYKFLFNNMAKKYLNYPEHIFVRENSGLNELSKYHLNNVSQNIDTVFYQKDLNINNIFKISNPEINIPKIKKNSVAIIPNSKLKKHNKNNNIKVIYKNIIESLLSQNRNIYIFRHSFEDLEFCNEIYGLVDSNKIHLFEDDFNAIELNYLLQEFDYIIGSRYHSVVHAYKNKVPALVIGWAVKYKELTNNFNQKKYCFDIRNKINLDDLLIKLEDMNNNCSNESNVISNIIDKITVDNIFDKVNNC